MTPSEYIQLKAFARVDGALLAVLWVASFACYIMGVANSFYGIVAMVLMLITPFFVGRRLGKFRDEGRGGIISFGRGWAYSVFVFFYAAILLALAQYAYFAFLDHGYLLQSFSKMMASPEASQVLRQYDMQQTMKESLDMMGQMRPIDYALNVLTMNIMIGILAGAPIAMLMQRNTPKNVKS